MASKEFNDISKVLKVMDQAFDLRVQFILSIKELIKKNNVSDQDAEFVLLAVAGLDDERIKELSNYADSIDFVFPDV